MRGRTRRRWTLDERAELVQLYKDGWSLPKLRDYFNCDTINQISVQIRAMKQKGLVQTKQEQRRWTEADDWTIIDLYGTIYRVDLAKLLDRTEAALKRRIVILGRQGLLTKPNNMTGRGLHGVSRSPWTMRKNVILVAKTCLHCGEFLPAISFTYSGGRYAPACKVCLRNYQSDPVRKHKKQQRDWKRGKANRNRLQIISVPKAHRAHTEWTDWEDDKLRDTNRSNFELAIELGRSYAAISTRRFRIDVKKYVPDSGKWVIKNDRQSA